MSRPTLLFRRLFRRPTSPNRLHVHRAWKPDVGSRGYRPLGALLVMSACLLAGCGPSAALTSDHSMDSRTPVVTAPAPGSPAADRLAAASTASRVYAVQLEAATASFVAAVGALHTHLTSGDLEAARTDELEAQSAYDAFRALEQSNAVNAASLDELASDVPDGSFSGLHAVERDLWSDQPAQDDVASLSAQAPVAQFLLSRLRLPPASICSTAVDQLGWVTDTALASSQEQFSHRGLVDVTATVHAAEQAVEDITPLSIDVAPAAIGVVNARLGDLDQQLAGLSDPFTTPDTPLLATLRPSLTRTIDGAAAALAPICGDLAPYGVAGALS